MVKLFRVIVLSLLTFALAAPASAEVVVIVNRENPISSLQRNQVVDLYMGRQLNFPNGSTALPIDLPPNDKVRSDFYGMLVGKSVAQINAYWARLLFTGRATPPRVLSGAAAVLKSVEKNPDAIAYLDSAAVNGKVKVVYRVR